MSDDSDWYVRTVAGPTVAWTNQQQLPARRFTCGWCGHRVSSDRGFQGGVQAENQQNSNGQQRTTGSSKVDASLYICPDCARPTYWDKVDRILAIGQLKEGGAGGKTVFQTDGEQTPGSLPGTNVEELPDGEVKELYGEARRCLSVSAYTGAILIFRTLLMQLAVADGAKPNQKFVVYVEHLRDKWAPRSAPWIDKIRKEGNDATHEVALKGEKDALLLLQFSEMLLRLIYEYPAKAT